MRIPVGILTSITIPNPYHNPTVKRYEFGHSKVPSLTFQWSKHDCNLDDISTSRNDNLPERNPTFSRACIVKYGLDIYALGPLKNLNNFLIRETAHAIPV